ncbi:MAG: transposase [Rhodospirillum sp.]|nr:transposase [Rhodospirillum sp.]MCF8487559.1 transposase [Rhodospirillum sp.]MCF8499042.1 transposase [Rhodospirillum sp.]
MEKLGKWTLEIVKRTEKAKGFEILPRHWGIERTFAWLGRRQRLAKDWEKSTFSAEAWPNAAHIRLTTRRITRYCHPPSSFKSGSKVLKKYCFL